jgi:tetratricopeptide (TPR) repeat protein
MLSSVERKMATAAELDKLRTAFRDNPRSTVFVALAQALVASGRAEEAIDISRQGLAIHPDHTEGRLGLARAYAALARWKEAEQELVKVVKLDRYHQKAFCLLGEVLIQRANWDVAVKALQRAHDLDPLDDRAESLLSKAQARQPLGPSEPQRPQLPPPPGATGSSKKKGRADFVEEQPTVVNTRGIPAEAMPTPAPVLTITPQKSERDDDTDVEASGTGVFPEPPTEPRQVAVVPLVKQKEPPVELPPPSAPPVTTATALPTPRHAAPIREPSPPPVPPTISFTPPAAAVPPAAPPAAPHPRKGPPAAPRSRRTRPLTTPHLYRPHPVPTIADRESPDQWLNDLLKSTPFDERSSIQPGEPGERWGNHLKRPFLWLWLGLIVLIGGSTGWYLADKWARDAAVAAHLATAHQKLISAGATDLALANDEAQQAIARDPSSVEAVTALAAARSLALLIYGDGQVQDVDTAIIAAKERLRIALDKPDNQIAELEYLDQKGGRDLVLAQTAFNLAALSRGLESKTNLKKVREHLDEALKRWPDDPQIVWLDGQLRLANGDRVGARAAFLKAADGFAVAGNDVGDLALDEGDGTAAWAAYTGVLEKAPMHPLALAGRAMVAAETGKKMKETQDELEPSLARVPGKRAEAWGRLAVSFLAGRLGEPDKAKQELDAAIATGNGEPRFLARTALALADEGQFEKAFITRARVRSKAADNLMPSVDGELFLASGRPEKAIEAVADAKGTRASLIRGRAYLDLGKPSEAQAIFSELSSANSDDLTLKAWVELAKIVADKQGVSGLARIAADKGAPPLVKFLLGEGQLVMGETAAAQKSFDASMDGNPLAYRAHTRVAEFKLASARKPDDVEAAETEARAALALAPAYLPARSVLGRALVRGGKQSEAAGELEAVVEAGRAGADDELAYAESLQARGDGDGAKEALRRAAQRGATAEALARVAGILGDPSLAAKAAPPAPAPAPAPKAPGKKRGK